MKFHSILIADDDASLVRVLEKVFIEKDFEVYTADNGIGALKQFYACMPKIILMDIDMPEKNGWEVLNQIRRENRRIPIAIMTGQYVEETNVIKTLIDEEASLFLRKSSSYKEIFAQVDALYRTAYSPEETFTFGKFTLDMSSYSLLINDEKYPLTDRGAQLLCLLVKNINQTVETKDILNSVWGSDSSSNNQMMRNYITKFNKLFEEYGEIHIKSIYGKGYSLQLCSFVHDSSVKQQIKT